VSANYVNSLYQLTIRVKTPILDFIMEPKMDNEKRVALVTGVTGAIGKAIARRISENRKYEIVILCRNKEKAKKAINDIAQATGNSNVRYELADISRCSSIKAASERWSGPLHVLINGAGVTPPRRQETPEGIELQFATNVLGYFWTIQSFLEYLRIGSPSRVINIASYWAGELDISDLEFKRRRYSNSQAYRQSKQANRMLTVAFAERLRSYGITVNACHPGDVNSRLSNNLGFGGHENPDEGARTPVWLAMNPIGQQVTGKYFEYMREVRCIFGENREAVEELFQVCMRY